MGSTSLALVAALAILLYHYILHPLFISPLAKIPAPHWSCHIAPLWVLRARYRRAENRSLLAAHRRLGPVVRVGPNDVSIDGADLVRAVYQGGFEKDGFYSVFNNYGVPNMFSELHSKPHSLRKRMISHTYSKSFLQSSESLRRQTAVILHQRLLPIFASAAAQKSLEETVNGGIDVQAVFLASSMDSITAYIHGLSRSTDFLGNKAYRSHWLRLYDARNENHFWPQELPGLTRALGCIGIHLVDDFVGQANAELAEWGQRLCDLSRAFVFGGHSSHDDHVADTKSISTGGTADAATAHMTTKRLGKRATRAVDDDSNPANDPVVFKAIHAGIDREEAAHGPSSLLYPTAILERDRSVASETFDHVTAGQETSGITLTYATYHLSRDPALQARLRAELRTLDPALLLVRSDDENTDTRGKFDNEAGGAGRSPPPPPLPPPEIPAPKAVDALPLLHAIILESLRLHAPIPGPQPRRTPAAAAAAGSRGRRGCVVLAGYDLPGNVRVAAAAHALHRNSDVFEDPDRWWPERWLLPPGNDDDSGGGGGDKAGGEKRREMMRWFWAFGSGGRMCIGSNFAMQGMKYVLAAIYSNFATSIADDTGIEQGDGYTARPASNRLYLKFERV